MLFKDLKETINDDENMQLQYLQLQYLIGGVEFNSKPIIISELLTTSVFDKFEVVRISSGFKSGFDIVTQILLTVRF